MTYLSTSVQEIDIASFTDPAPSTLEERHVGLCKEELVNLMEYRPLLEGDGFLFKGYYNQTGSSEDEAVDLQSLMGDPEPLRNIRISLTRENEEHFKAWQAQESPLTNLKLDDACKSPISDAESTPCVHSHYTIPKQAEKEIVPYATCLETILLSDACPYTIDDAIQVFRDVTNKLADLHAVSVPYADMRVKNIYINDRMRAFLIRSDKSQKENDKARLIEECQKDVKAMCRIIGGMLMFYIRNKPLDSRDSNQEDKMLYNLLKRGSRGSLTASDMLEELGQIVVSDEVLVDQPVEASTPESGLTKKKQSCLGQVAGDNSPESEARDGQGQELDSGTVNRVSVPGAASFVDDRGLVPRSGSIGNPVPNQTSAAVDVRCSKPVPEPGAVDTNAPSPSSEAIMASTLVPEELAVSMVLSGLGTEAVSNQSLEIGSGAFADQGGEYETGDDASGVFELWSGEVDNENLDRENSDQASTRQQLLAEMEMEMYFSASESSLSYDARD